MTSKPPSLRPGFPRGLEVLLIESDAAALKDAKNKLQELSYSVTSCEECSLAVGLLKAGRGFDVILAEARIMDSTGTAQRQLLAAAANLPLILTTEDATSTDNVWKGIELGAAEVLVKPLSSLKLQNIWQHVVRKLMTGHGAKALAALTLNSADSKEKAGIAAVIAPSSPITPLSVGSAGGSATINSDSLLSGDKSGRACDYEASTSVGVPDCADSARSTLPHTARAMRTALRKPCSNTAMLPALTPVDSISRVLQQPLDAMSLSRHTPSTSLTTHASSQHPQGLGLPQQQQQALALPHPQNLLPGLLPHQTPHPVPGCAWGTPLPLAQGLQPPVRPAAGGFSGPGRCTMPAAARHACGSSAVASGTVLGSMQVPLVFPDGGKLEGQRPSPIGLTLRKSASLLDLINMHTTACA